MTLGNLLISIFWLFYIFPVFRFLDFISQTSLIVFPIAFFLFFISKKEKFFPKVINDLWKSKIILFIFIPSFIILGKYNLQDLFYILVPILSSSFAFHILKTKNFSYKAIENLSLFSVIIGILMILLKFRMPWLSTHTTEYSSLAFEPSTATYSILILLFFGRCIKKENNTLGNNIIRNSILLLALQIIFGFSFTLFIYIIVFLIGLLLSYILSFLKKLKLRIKKKNLVPFAGSFIIISLLLIFNFNSLYERIDLKINQKNIPQIIQSASLEEIVGLSFNTSDYRIRQFYIAFSEPFRFHTTSNKIDSKRMLSKVDYLAGNSAYVVPKAAGGQFSNASFLLSLPLSFLLYIQQINPNLIKFIQYRKTFGEIIIQNLAFIFTALLMFLNSTTLLSFGLLTLRILFDKKEK